MILLFNPKKNRAVRHSHVAGASPQRASAVSFAFCILALTLVAIVPARAQERVNSFTTNHTITKKDCSTTVYMTGTSSSVILPSPKGFRSPCAVRVVNASSRGQRLSGFPPGYPRGCGGACLFPRQTTTVAIMNHLWVTLEFPGLWQSDGASVFVDPTGSDTANDGLSKDSPFRTIQHAYNTIISSVAQNGGIQLVCSAPYHENLILTGFTVGNHMVVIVGDVDDPSKCVLESDGTAAGINCTDYCTLEAKGITIEGGGPAIAVSQHSTFDLTDDAFGSCGSNGGPFVRVLADGKVNLIGPITWANAQSCTSLFDAQGAGAEIDLNGETITVGSAIDLNSGPLFSAFYNGVILGPWKFVGSDVSASKYDVELNGVLSQSGSSYPPGVHGGTETTGGRVQ